MSKSVNPFSVSVSGLSDEQFSSRKCAVNSRLDKEKYDAVFSENTAIEYGLKPVFPKCGSVLYHEDGYTASGQRRYECSKCRYRYSPISDSVFRSAGIQQNYGVKRPLILSAAIRITCFWGRVWIDETYIEDYEVLAVKDGKHLRGLSRSKICIVVAIDQSRNMAAVISGHGKPSSKRIITALKDHIKEGSAAVHDGDRSYAGMNGIPNYKEEVYKAIRNDFLYLKKDGTDKNNCSRPKNISFVIHQ